MSSNNNLALAPEQPTIESEVPPVTTDYPPVTSDDPPAVFLSSDTSVDSLGEGRDVEVNIDGDQEEASHVAKSTGADVSVTVGRAADGLHQADSREDGEAASLNLPEPRVDEALNPQEQTERVGESPEDSDAA
ncbi:hypothetical protein Bca101_042638 [Brassica carinata]